MKGLLRAPLLAAIALIALYGIVGCKSPRIHREDNKPRLARKSADAPIDAFVGKLSRPYEKIAVVDSERYKSNDKESKLRMIEDLKKRARQVGADAVQNLQVLNVQIQGGDSG